MVEQSDGAVCTMPTCTVLERPPDLPYSKQYTILYSTINWIWQSFRHLEIQKLLDIALFKLKSSALNGYLYMELLYFFLL